MKKNLIFIGLAVVLMIFSINNFMFEIDNKAHYFVNGIICGVAASVIVVQALKIKKNKTQK